jgi:sulfite reductase (NADPH) flavoprotein alpha-component
MLISDKLALLEEVLSTFNREELFWLNGYIQGKLSTSYEAGTATPVQPSINKITITYGTETGNSKKLAAGLAAKAKQNGINSKIVSLDQYRLSDLPKEEYFFSIISTQGEGEPPAAAKTFYDHIHKNGFKLSKLKYGVLALGDTAYPLFCKAGEDIDKQLNDLGGQRIIPLQKCDVDYEAEAGDWFDQVFQALSSAHAEAGAQPPAPKTGIKATGRKNYHGTILSNVNLNDRGSEKETHHIEIAAEGLQYQPGDSLGVVPENPAGAVEAILQLLAIDRTRKFTFRNQEFTGFDLLKKKVNIAYLPERVVSQYASLTGHDIPATKISLFDLLRIYPLAGKDQFGALANILEPIAPRLYSISSSPEAHDGEIHITVARDKFTISSEQKCGLCSGYLTALPTETDLEFYIHKNNGFRLPAPDKDIIMIGPGTGIAPFRSFLAHRDATGSTGRNWLFFGDQHFVTDFLYQTELQNWKATGTLNKINLAFSRDQQEKVYVQHKMLENGAEFYHWVNNGALVYVCGSREPMSRDVEDCIIDIVAKFGNKTTEEAVQYVEQLKDDGRYLKDVY